MSTPGNYSLKSDPCSNGPSPNKQNEKAVSYRIDNLTAHSNYALTETELNSFASDTKKRLVSGLTDILICLGCCFHLQNDNIS